MSLKKITQVRGDKGFKILDLILYGGLIVLIVALFIAFVFFKDTSPLKGVEIYVKNNLVFTYDFEAGKYTVADENVIEVVDDGTTELKIKIVTENDGYNYVTINKSESWVDLTDANCSYRKDCVHMTRISDVSSTIICTPHAVQIVPVGYQEEEDNGLIIG
jgi:hypothetical protein